MNVFDETEWNSIDNFDGWVGMEMEESNVCRKKSFHALNKTFYFNK